MNATVGFNEMKKHSFCTLLLEHFNICVVSYKTKGSHLYSSFQSGNRHLLDLLFFDPAKLFIVNGAGQEE